MCLLAASALAADARLGKYAETSRLLFSITLRDGERALFLFMEVLAAEVDVSESPESLESASSLVETDAFFWDTEFSRGRGVMTLAGDEEERLDDAGDEWCCSELSESDSSSSSG